MFVVDANLLVYAANDSAPENERCRGLVDGWREQTTAWYTTWGIVYEFLKVVTHPKVLRRPWTPTRSWAFVEALLASPALDVLVETDRHGSVVEEVLRDVPGIRGGFVHDAHTAILMREHGLRTIYTRDEGFRRFPFLEVVDPLA